MNYMPRGTAAYLVLSRVRFQRQKVPVDHIVYERHDAALQSLEVLSSHKFVLKRPYHILAHSHMQRTSGSFGLLAGFSRT